MIELNSVSFSYGKKTVFRDLSVSFEPGTFYGIIGPNGCGKTTLIRLLCRLERPSKGAVSLNGAPLNSYGRKALAREVSLLPQFKTLPSVSAEELVSLGRYPHLGGFHALSQTDRDAVKEALQRAEASDLAQRNVATLSGGERQRVCTALLLAQNTPTVLLDEPTTYLDISHRFSLLQRLRELRTEGRCVIAVLHDLSLALRFCDRLLVLDGGTVKGFCTPEETVSSGVLDEVFSVRCLRAEADGTAEYVFVPK